MALTKHCLILSGDCANVYCESYELNKYHFVGFNALSIDVAP